MSLQRARFDPGLGELVRGARRRREALDLVDTLFAELRWIVHRAPGAPILKRCSSFSHWILTGYSTVLAEIARFHGRMARELISLIRRFLTEAMPQLPNGDHARLRRRVFWLRFFVPRRSVFRHREGGFASSSSAVRVACRRRCDSRGSVDRLRSEGVLSLVRICATDGLCS
jgi:hypothetical protein